MHMLPKPASCSPSVSWSWLPSTRIRSLGQFCTSSTSRRLCDASGWATSPRQMIVSSACTRRLYSLSRWWFHLLDVPERAVPRRQHRAVRQVQVRPDPGPFRRPADDRDRRLLHQRRQASFLGRLARARALQRKFGFSPVADGLDLGRVWCRAFGQLECLFEAGRWRPESWAVLPQRRRRSAHPSWDSVLRTSSG